MARRVEYVPLEEARRLGRELGIPEAQASRSAFRMLAIEADAEPWPPDGNAPT